MRRAGADRIANGGRARHSEIMRRAGTSKVTVWRWQERFMRAGVEGLLRDKTRPSRIPPLPASVHERTVSLTLGDPPGEATHWTAATMAKAAGISVSSVQRIWRAHGLQPHRAYPPRPDFAVWDCERDYGSHSPDDRDRQLAADRR
jgi:transposase